MADISGPLAAFAATANPANTGTTTTTGPGAGLSPDALAQLLGTDQSAAAPGAGQLAPGVAKRTASSLNVPLPGPPSISPPPTPDAPGPQYSPPPTPNVPGPQYQPPPTPNALRQAPAPAASPPPPPNPILSQMINPSRVIQGPVGSAAAPPITDTRAAAMAGDTGDNMLGHLTGGASPDTIVPHPVLRDNPALKQALHAAMIAKGANPSRYTAGSRAASVNPNTGLQEFGFMETILPMALAAAGSMAFPALLPALAPELAATLAGGGAIASALPGIAGGFAGGLAGREIADPQAGLGANALGAGLSSIGSGLAGAMVPSVGAAAGAGANAAAGAGVGSPLPAGWAGGTGGIATNLATGATSDIPGVPMPAGYAAGTGGIMTNLATGATSDMAVPAASSPGFFQNLLDHPINTLTGGKGLLGAGLSMAGGMTGDMIANSILPAKNANKIADAASGNGPQLASDDELRQRYARILNVPGNDYLSTYGASPQTPPVRFFG